ncbi:CarD family transcriptional regulator [Oikeobacillus pervagus]|uniref:CarD family transcriptional regulator n=1 Tax=Oikeobacillus pervagus TaxID=1325931 RepID=A0AAJ1T871_9BACI|nr:CarD family transcriptional regulator [Oikeobacillus pervagus]
MFQVGDKIVYPMHGAGVVKAIEDKEILGKTQQYYIIQMLIDNMQVMIPTNNVDNIGIRPVSDRPILKKVLQEFQTEETEDSLPWKQRHRKNLMKMQNGEIHDVAEVIHDLMSRSEEKKLNSSEKHMLVKAKKIFISELELIKGINNTRAIDLFNAQLKKSC